MPDREQSAEVATEGSAAVLNQVKGRLERMETGELPVIERVGPDGTTRRVDHTGEMVRPEAAEIDGARAAAEAFAAEHRAGTTGPKAAQRPDQTGPPSQPEEAMSAPARPGLWARITAWFRRS